VNAAERHGHEALRPIEGRLDHVVDDHAGTIPLP
jgi:hypothetical protein